MIRKRVSALHSSELEKLGSDPNDPGDEIWQLSLRIRVLKEQLDSFAQECQEELSLQNVCFLEGIQCWCDDIVKTLENRYSDFQGGQSPLAHTMCRVLPM